MGHLAFFATVRFYQVIFILSTLATLAYFTPIIEPDPECVYVKEFEEVSFECPSTGFQTQPIEWKRHDGPLPLNHLAHENYLKLTNVSRISSGNYCCYFLGVKKKEFLLVAEFAPEIAMSNSRLAGQHDGSSLDSEEFLCSASASPLAYLKWFRNGKEIRNTSDYTVVNIPVTAVTKYSSESKLSVSSEVKFLGKIQCKAENMLGSAYYEISFDNPVSEETQEPTIFGNSTKTEYVMEGQEAKLSCYVGGNPPPMVSWRFNGIPISGTKISVNEYCLTIPNATTDNFGTYSCIAENGVGENQLQDMQLLVGSPPRVNMPREIVEQALGYKIDLGCTFCGCCITDVYMSKRGVRLSTTSEHKIRIFSSGNNCVDIKAYIENVENHHVGNYNCHCKNKYGTAKSSVTLMVSDQGLSGWSIAGIVSAALLIAVFVVIVYRYRSHIIDLFNSLRRRLVDRLCREREQPSTSSGNLDHSPTQ